MNITSKPNERQSVAATQLEILLDEREYARLTGRSVASLRRDRLLGIGCPYVKLGALVRYRPQDVQAFIERNLRGGEAHDERTKRNR
jgi:hypothetical protein